MTTHHGECLCGEVTWEFTGEPENASLCHCTMCRKAHGAAFGTYYFVRADRFRMTGSEGGIRHYRSSNELARAFCGNCGSVVPQMDDDNEHYFIPAGPHTHGPAVPYHIFVGSKAPWHEITDDLPQHDGDPPLAAFFPERSKT